MQSKARKTARRKKSALRASNKSSLFYAENLQLNLILDDISSSQIFRGTKIHKWDFFKKYPVRYIKICDKEKMCKGCNWYSIYRNIITSLYKTVTVCEASLRIFSQKQMFLLITLKLIRRNLFFNNYNNILYIPQIICHTHTYIDVIRLTHTSMVPCDSCQIVMEITYLKQK